MTSDVSVFWNMLKLRSNSYLLHLLLIDSAQFDRAEQTHSNRCQDLIEFESRNLNNLVRELVISYVR